jgi:cysteine desulfurase
VLKALGVSDSLAHGSLRFGVGRFTTEEEVDFAVEKITAAVKAEREKTVVQ